MFKNGTRAPVILLALSVIFVSALSIQSIFAANLVVFSSQDAAVPGLNLTVQEGTDVTQYVSGGVMLGPSLTSNVLEGTLHLRKSVDYGIRYCETVDVASKLYSSA